MKRPLALTFDDLPYAASGDDYRPAAGLTAHSVLSDLTRSLDHHRAPALGLVNGFRVNSATEPALMLKSLIEWRDAGYTLGNHTFSHIAYRRSSFAIYTDDVDRNALFLSRNQLLTSHVRWFRHPFLDRGSEIQAQRRLDRYLKQNSYRIAPVTIDTEDYRFNDALSLITKRHRARLIERIRDDYLQFVLSRCAYAEAAAKATFGSAIPHFLLLHSNDLNALFLGAVLELLKSNGYVFVPAEDAINHPAYKSGARPVDLSQGYLSLSEGRLAAKSGEKPYVYPRLPSWIVRSSTFLRAKTNP